MYFFDCTTWLERCHGSAVLIAQDATQAQYLAEQLRFWTHAPVLEWPEDVLLPYEEAPVSAQWVAALASTIDAIAHYAEHRTWYYVVASVSSVIRRLPETSVLTRYLNLSVGQTYDLSTFKQYLKNKGYTMMHQACAPGTFSMKGEIVDMVMTTSAAYRLRWCIDHIESIACLDPDTQRSVALKQNIHIAPTHLIEAQHLERLLPIIYQQDASYVKRYKNKMQQGEHPPGIQWWLPYVDTHLSSFWDYLPSSLPVLVMPNTQMATYAACVQQYAKPGWPDPSALFCEDWLPEDPSRVTYLPEKEAVIHPLPLQKTMVTLSQDKAVLLAVDRHARLTWWQTLLVEQTVPVITHISQWCITHPITLTVCGVLQNATLSDRCIVAEHTDMIIIKPAKKHTASIATLHIGHYIVHEMHGIAKLLGLESIKHADGQDDCYVLEFAQQAKLYVPVLQASQLHPYTAIEPVTCSVLGGLKWQKTRQQAMLALTDVAAECLKTMALRKTVSGPKCAITDQYLEFSSDFKHEPTPDQTKAIHDIENDMCHEGPPMDRLLCGDVGFGKTEVAMRALFIAVFSGYQAALIAPTTVLAEQHHHTLIERFAKWSVSILLLSRTTHHAPDAIASAALIIGTHAVLHVQQWRCLGLVIVDEEHKFGVAQKEHFKHFRKNVHVLSLTATPIPRTLQAAVTGLKTLSFIQTPPVQRLPVYTTIMQDEEKVRDAILRERLRGGQIYVVHPHVHALQSLSENIARIAPFGTRLAIAHGQLDDATLRMRMAQFYQKRVDILVCSALIENGLDVPTANTIIIYRADCFGLAQLHQLRGRVGRSHQQAYAGCVIPQRLTDDAEKRLETFMTLNHLGSGLAIATSDLDIRGHGDWLSDRQSGHLKGIGMALYSKWLADVTQLLSGTVVNPDVTLDLKIPAYLPDAYITHLPTRIAWYQDIANASTEVACVHYMDALIDQYGPLPEPAENLLQLRRLALIAKQAGMVKLYKRANILYVTFGDVSEQHVQALLHWSKQHDVSLTEKGFRTSLPFSEWLTLFRSLPIVESL
jgi:transcription-repair coupling factor (superfamily II helicase)